MSCLCLLCGGSSRNLNNDKCIQLHAFFFWREIVAHESGQAPNGDIDAQRRIFAQSEEEQERRVLYAIRRYPKRGKRISRIQSRRVPRQDNSLALRRSRMEQLHQVLCPEFRNLRTQETNQHKLRYRKQKCGLGLAADFVETENPLFSMDKTKIKGKIFTLTKDENADGKINIDDLKWNYMEGDGDFRSEEVQRLKDEADFIITNPPFSLFKEFFTWLIDSRKQFLIIGSINAISYKEIFLQIKNNKVWLGNGMGRWISGFIVPEGYELYGTEARIDENGNRIVATNNCLWLTNLEHGRRHQPLELNTMAQNRKHSKHKEVRDNGYPHYDNYDAIDVPFTDAIPCDYDGVMGVPITFLDKYCPDQFEILGQMVTTKIDEYNFGYPYINGKKVYARILIKNRSIRK